MLVRRPFKERPEIIHREEHADLPMGQVKLSVISKQTNVSLDQLIPVVRAGFFKVIKNPSRGLGDIIVERPSRAVLVWLMQMMRPLAMRPLIRLTEVADQLSLTHKELKLRCTEAGLKFHNDPAFGELLTPKDLGKLLAKVVPRWHDHPRFDRISMLQFLAGEPISNKMQYRSLSYNERLERELKRVSRMAEPYRTLRAITIMESLRDAKTIAGAIKEYRRRLRDPDVVRADQAVSRLMSNIVPGSEAPPA